MEKSEKQSIVLGQSKDPKQNNPKNRLFVSVCDSNKIRVFRTTSIEKAEKLLQRKRKSAIEEAIFWDEDRYPHTLREAKLIQIV